MTKFPKRQCRRSNPGLPSSLVIVVWHFTEVTVSHIVHLAQHTSW